MPYALWGSRAYHRYPGQPASSHAAPWPRVHAQLGEPPITWGLHMGWVDRWGTGLAPPCEEPRSLLIPNARSTGGRQQHASLTSSPQPYRHGSRIPHTAKLGEHVI